MFDAIATFVKGTVIDRFFSKNQIAPETSLTWDREDEFKDFAENSYQIVTKNYPTVTDPNALWELVHAHLVETHGISLIYSNEHIFPALIGNVIEENIDGKLDTQGPKLPTKVNGRNRQAIFQEVWDQEALPNAWAQSCSYWMEKANQRCRELGIRTIKRSSIQNYRKIAALKSVLNHHGLQDLYPSFKRGGCKNIDDFRGTTIEAWENRHSFKGVSVADLQTAIDESSHYE